MSVAAVRHFVERAYRESGELQYLREASVNCLQAGATRIEFGPEWHAVEHDGVYRLMIADNGCGIDDPLGYLNTFGGGGKPIGDAHENYGVGLKSSLLPWNHFGVIVMSWTKSNPGGSMIWLAHDPTTGEYGAKPFATSAGDVPVVRPFGKWLAAKPDWITDHGTVIIALGMTGKENTFVGKDGEGDSKAIAAYLNRRLWEIPTGVEIFVQELRSTKRTDWPRSLAEANGAQAKSGPDRRWNRRQIRGASFYVHGGERPIGKVASTGTVPLDDGTAIDWYLWEGERPNIHSYAQKNGFIAALYENELYDTEIHLARYRSFGITQKEVRENLTLIARPPIARGSYGVYPDTARSGLKIQGTKRAGEPLPWSEWAHEFAEKMPEPIQAALAKAGPQRNGSIDDPSWRKRLEDRFAARWKTKRWVADAKGTALIEPDSLGIIGLRIHGDDPRPDGPEKPRSPQDQTTGDVPGSGSEGVVAAAAPVPTGTVRARQTTAMGGLPDYEWTTLENLHESQRYAAAWVRPTKDRPHGTIQLARDFPPIVDVKNHWRAQYPDHLGEQVDHLVEEVYGETMVARIAHSEHLTRDARWSRSHVENELRSPEALTMALLGLYSEDHVLRDRLARLGPKRRGSS